MYPNKPMDVIFFNLQSWRTRVKAVSKTTTIHGECLGNLIKEAKMLKVDLDN
jgi:hypothetical protein